MLRNLILLLLLGCVRTAPHSWRKPFQYFFRCFVFCQKCSWPSLTLQWQANLFLFTFVKKITLFFKLLYQVVSKLHNMPLIVLFILYIKAPADKVHTSNTRLLCEKGWLLSKHCPRTCMYQRFRFLGFNVNEVVWLRAWADQEWKFSDVETWQWADPVLLLVPWIKSFDYSYVFEVLNYEKVTRISCQYDSLVFYF